MDGVDSSDDEVEIHGRLAMLGDKPNDLKKGVFESLERGAGNLSLRGDREHGDEDEDDKDKRWEEEQFRKGFGKRVDDASNTATASQVPAAGVSAPASTSAPGSFQVGQTVGYAAAPPQNWRIAGSWSAEVMSLSQHADVTTRALQESIQRLRETYGRTKADLHRTDENLSASLMNITVLEKSLASAGEKYVFMQKFRDFIAVLCEFLKLKLVHLWYFDRSFRDLGFYAVANCLEIRLMLVIFMFDD